jgi:hypothetical protein
MFHSEFAPNALRAGVAAAEKFGSARAYLLRVQADAEAELAQVALVAQNGSEYEKQFCPKRAAECYAALSFVALGLGLYDQPDPSEPFAVLNPA